jgi:hypothetical protein
MMVRIIQRPRPATAGEAATDGHTTRIVVSLTSGGTKPVTACFRPSVIVPIHNSLVICHLSFVIGHLYRTSDE